MHEEKTQAIKEALNPDLWDHFDTDEGVIDHPLVQVLVLNPQDADRANQLYERKINGQVRAGIENDWESYVFLHERPYRLSAFMDIRGELANSQYWYLLSNVWMDTEFPWQGLSDWKALWSSNRPEKHFAMRQDERDALEAMPDEIIVYRGSGFPHKYGISWTLGRDIAARFARRFHRESYLLTAKIKKGDVHAYLGRRSEREIIAEKFEVLQREIVFS